MPVYASTSGFGAYKRHPNAFILIVGGHAVLIGAVMTAKMDLPTRLFDPPIVVQPIPVPPPPKPVPPEATQPAPPQHSRPYRPEPLVPVPVPDVEIVDSTPVPLPHTGPNIGPGTGPTLTPIPAVVRTGPRFATPDRLIKPPYPVDKQRLEEEATLRLRLSIDDRGRVVAVEPVGKVDRSFLEAARKHLLAHWRYKPATEDGRGVASSTVISLTFRIES